MHISPVKAVCRHVYTHMYMALWKNVTFSFVQLVLVSINGCMLTAVIRKIILICLLLNKGKQ